MLILRPQDKLTVLIFLKRLEMSKLIAQKIINSLKQISVVLQLHLNLKIFQSIQM